MQTRAKKTWEKLETIDEELVNETRELNRQGVRDHYWWNRIGAKIYNEMEPPEY